MRISTQLLFQQGLNGILDAQESLATTQRQLATGQRVNQPSDDPIAAARIQELERAVAQQDVYVNNIGRVRQRLNAEEDALSSAGEVIQRVRELAVQASSDTVNESDRQLIAVELRERRDQLIAIANTRDGDGEYLFAGSQSTTRPFVAAAGGVDYVGDSVQRELLIGPGTTMADRDTGDEVFMRIREGNGVIGVAQGPANTGTGFIIPEPTVDGGSYAGGSFTIRFTAADAYEVVDATATVIQTGTYTAGETISFNGVGVEIRGEPDAGDEFTVAPARFESVFATIDQLAEALEAAPVTDAARAVQRQGIDDALGQLDNVETRLLEVRAGVGGRLNTIDDVQATREDLQLGLQELTSDLRDVDYAEAISLLQQELTALQAAQQTFTRIQGNSLFRFL